MELQDYPWTSQPLFMQQNLVQEYLTGYAQDIQQNCGSRVKIWFNSEVVRLIHVSNAGGHWELTWKSVLTGASTTSRYLYVVIAVGVFDEPFMPSYEGLPAWREKWKGSVSHAKSFRDPTNFRGKVRPMSQSQLQTSIFFLTHDTDCSAERSHCRISGIRIRYRVGNWGFCLQAMDLFDTTNRPMAYRQMPFLYPEWFDSSHYIVLLLSQIGALFGMSTT